MKDEAVGGMSRQICGSQYAIVLDQGLCLQPVPVGKSFHQIGSVAIESDRWNLARSVVIGSGSFVVAGGFVLATRDFEFVADAVPVGIAQANARAIVPGVSVGT